MDIARVATAMVIGSKRRDMIFVAVVVAGFSVACIRL